MAAAGHQPDLNLPAEVAAPDWAGLCDRARANLLHDLAARGVLSPRDVARAVVAVLPRPLGRWFWGRLTDLGWLDPQAIVPFDVLDGPSCPADLRGACRPLVRLALFGPPGQGLAWRDRHRHDVFQQLCAEIMRDAVDLVSLEHVSQRVMNNADVCGDSVLAAWLRSFIAEREAALRTFKTPAEEQARHEEESKLRYGFLSPTGRGIPTQQETLDALSRLQREFDAYLAQFEDRKALRVLERIRELRRRFPAHVPADDLQRCETQMDRLLKRAGQYRRQIEELAGQAAAAARDGDDQTAAWLMRRLDAIHALLPNVLTAVQLERLRSEIHRGGQEHESEEAARALRERKLEVAAKIKSLAGIIQRFHEVAGRLPPEHNAYRRAELNYRQAVEEIRGMNTEWLTSLVLELETLLDDLDDPSGQMQSQLDQFITQVRTALNRLCLEIRAHRKPPPTRPEPGPRPEEPPPPA